MKETWLFIFVAVHALSAIAWVGGMIFIAAVLVPLARRMQPPGSGMTFVRAAATRFRRVAWPLLATLVLSGIVILEIKGIGFSRWGDASFWRSEVGRVLLIKGVLVGLLLALSSYHDFVLGPRVARLIETADGSQPSEIAATARRRLVQLARLNLLLALAIVVLGLMVLRGIPG